MRRQVSWAWSAPMNRPFEQGIDPDRVGILEIFRVKLDDTLEMRPLFTVNLWIEFRGEIQVDRVRWIL